DLRPVVPRRWRLSVVPTARNGRTGDRWARHLPRLRHRAGARPGRAVARASAGDVPSVSPWTAARASFPLVGDVLGEPAQALAHVRVPVLPVVLARPLRVRAGDPPGRELGVERARLV